MRAVILAILSRCFFTGHKWQERERFQVTRTGAASNEVVYIDVHLCCQKCGDWKRARL